MLQPRGQRDSPVSPRSCCPCAPRSSHSPLSQTLVPGTQHFAPSTTHELHVFQNVRHGSGKERTGMLLLRIVTPGAVKHGRKWAREPLAVSWAQGWEEEHWLLPGLGDHSSAQLHRGAPKRSCGRTCSASGSLCHCSAVVGGHWCRWVHSCLPWAAEGASLGLCPEVLTEPCPQGTARAVTGAGTGTREHGPGAGSRSFQ